jgi:hypothetical protein
MSTRFSTRFIAALLAAALPSLAKPAADPSDQDVRTIDNGTVKIGVDLKKGAAITWLSWSAYPKNMVNIADPGRLIQQSYYSGKRRNRTQEGQWKSWSPWPWNPIQGGGVESWARVTKFESKEKTLFSETIPKLWDMPNEEAAAVMKQWTSFEPGMPNVAVVRCEFVSDRSPDDKWGPAHPTGQEVPACYFTRNFDQIQSYLGDGKWRTEEQPAGPPWGRTKPPLLAMACFNKDGQGVGIYSPTSGETWNFGPHTTKMSNQPTAGPCVHVAPVSRVRLPAKSSYQYRYWLVVGDKQQIASRLDELHRKYADERATLRTPDKTP